MLNLTLEKSSPVRPFELTRQDKNYIQMLNSRWDRLELPWIHYRYDVGHFVAAHLRGNLGRYREILERIAEGMPQHPSTLRTWASVPMAFPVNEFRSLVQRKTARGNRLFWTQYVLLARVPDTSVREQFIEQVFAEDLRTLELQDRIRAWEADNWLLQFRGSNANSAAMPSLQEHSATADEIMTVPYGRPAARNHELAAGAV